MKNKIYFLFIEFFVATVPYAASADYITDSVKDLAVRNNLVIADTGRVENMNIEYSSSILNYGTITGNVNVCKGCQIQIENAGHFVNTNFEVPESTTIVQLVKNNEDINSIGLTNFDVLVDNASMISWDGITNISAGANKIILKNSSIQIIDDISLITKQSHEPEIELRGENTVYLNNVFDYTDVPVLSNVSGDGTVRVSAEHDNPLYNLTSRLESGFLYIDVVRNTDYSRILKDDSGKFLNSLRKENPNDNLLTMLDNAESVSEIKDIMSMSARLNPIKLMEPVSVFNSFEINNFGLINSGIFASPIFLSSKNFNAYGIQLDGAYEFTDAFQMGASLYASKLNFSDEIDEYNFALYGGNVHIAYSIDYIFTRVIAGATVADFDIGSVFNNSKIITNPVGFTFYSAADIGTSFDIGSHFGISPFARVLFNSENISDITDEEFTAGIGTDLSFNISGYDINYIYGMSISAYADKQIYAAVHMDIISNIDKIGGCLEAGIVRDELGSISYKLKLGATLKF